MRWSSADISLVPSDSMGLLDGDSGRDQQTGRERFGPAADDSDFGPGGHLVGASRAPQLQARFVDGPEPVHAAGGELAAVGADGKLALQRDALAALDEAAALVLGDQPKGLEPADGEDREAVVHLGYVNIGRRD